MHVAEIIFCNEIKLIIFFKFSLGWSTFIWIRMSSVVWLGLFAAEYLKNS